MSPAEDEARTAVTFHEASAKLGIAETRLRGYFVKTLGRTEQKSENRGRMQSHNNDFSV
jgi:hypothetical protein